MICLTCPSQFGNSLARKDGKTSKSIILKYDIDYSHFHKCMAYKDIIGKKYNKLTILDIYSVYNKNNRIVFTAKCVCDCGNKKDIIVSHIKYNKIGSCGCDKSGYNKTRGERSKLYTGYKKISGKLWGNIKSGAKRRNLDFNITIQYAWDIYKQQYGKCALSGMDIGFDGTSRESYKTSASLDRIDNHKVYIEGNVRWVLKDINMIRGSYDSGYFIKLCNAVAKTHPR